VEDEATAEPAVTDEAADPEAVAATDDSIGTPGQETESDASGDAPAPAAARETEQPAPPASTPVPEPTTPAPTPQVAEEAPAAVTPAPATTPDDTPPADTSTPAAETEAPAPEPEAPAVEPDPQPVTAPPPARTRPAPAAPRPAAPAPQQPSVREGDLVPAGPGVRPPVLVSFDKPEYPRVARRMKVEGTVVMSLLVDETGQVTDVRLEQGVNLNVGINEAALAAARTARFRPATKDGVKVKTWHQLTIPFKL
jgi:TonB family protein